MVMVMDNSDNTKASKILQIPEKAHKKELKVEVNKLGLRVGVSVSPVVWCWSRITLKIC